MAELPFGNRVVLYYFNNIVYNLGNGSYSFGTTGQTRNIQNNIFYGTHPSNEPADPNKLTTNPLFVNPGQGTAGINALLDGYKLQVNSPALASGRVITTNGGRDFWMNNVNSITAPNRGAYQGAGLLSNESWESNSVKVYPNPVKGILNLSYSEAINSVKVINMLGQELLSKEVNAATAQIDLSNFTNGTYIIQITIGSTAKTVKVIKI